MTLDWEAIFSIASTAALIAWALLILLPRWDALIRGLRFGLLSLFAIAYAGLMFVFFFQAEGGGYGSLAEVAALFSKEPVLLAGWIHYLAFDLFVGLWIAEKADAIGINRLVQAPILVATFMFGPLGLLLYYAARATLGRREGMAR